MGRYKMTYLLIGAYFFLGITISAFFYEDLSDHPSLSLIFFWPIVFPIALGFYLADKVKGKE